MRGPISLPKDPELEVRDTWRRQASCVELQSITLRVPTLSSMLLPNWSYWNEVYLLALVLSVLYPMLVLSYWDWEVPGLLLGGWRMRG